jgi:hypothetical protein
MPDDLAVARNILQALDEDFAASVPAALGFLRRDPPLFFRQMVVERLDQILPEPSGLDPALPYADTVNQEAAARLGEVAELLHAEE